MSEHSTEAERVDESVVDGGGSSIDADVAASGTDGGEAGAGEAGVGDGTEEGVADSHAADVAAGFDDPQKAPVQPAAGEDGTF